MLQRSHFDLERKLNEKLGLRANLSKDGVHPSEAGTARRPDWPGLASVALLAAGTLAVYGRTFSVPLLFDDNASIADNPSIRRLWPLGSALSPPSDVGVGGRPLLNLSYAVNYAFGGTGVSGYHGVNVLIHVLAALTLFALVRRTLLLPILAGRFGAAATPLALAVSAIWAWHPVQTESVTYLSQRAESLMGLFYLLTLYCFVRGAGTKAEGKGVRRTWFALSVLACLAGVGSKEVIVTAPVMVLLYDRTFLSGGFSGAWRRHRPVYLALAASWLPLGYLMIGLDHRGAGFGQGVAGWAYGLAECRVVVKYLLLALWPKPLIFDYGVYAAALPSEIWPYALVLTLLLIATVAALRRAPAAGFAACWFFLILAPTSSVVPIATQPMAENRLYVPLAGVVAFVVLAVFAGIGRRSLPFFAFLAAGLGLASAQRNRDYASEQSIWSDTVAKNPADSRAHNNLGNVWLGMPGRLDDAIAEFQESVRLEPDHAKTHNNLGNAWAKMPGRLNEAITEFQEAVRLKPDYAEAHNNLGNAWLNLPGRVNEAVAEFEEAIRLKPDYAEAHYNLGTAWTRVPGRLKDAIAQFGEAVRLEPDYAEAHNNLGTGWSSQPGRLDDAIAEYREAVRLKPDYAQARFNLAVTLLKCPGRGEEAAAQLKTVLQLQPGNGAARQILARIQRVRGDAAAGARP